ncbi:MAG: ribosome small subunit-dependent GTPase A [Planctomycetales bacterium]|nr:ribosome small subunit-dependent GTPase A [Planctomycetales bacterium]
MAAKRDKKKIRANFRKNREARAREQGWTRKYRSQEIDIDQIASTERVSGKGAISRRRTIVADTGDHDEGLASVMPAVDESVCIAGRVLSIHGLASVVLARDGQMYSCATRRLLKSIETSQRHVVAVGDRVMLRPAGGAEGIIERIEPRHGLLSRTSRGRQHVMVANVDQLLIIGSAGEPDIKPNLIDRMILAATTAGIEPIICINKIDLLDPAELQALAGVWGQLGYVVHFLSATEGHGIATLRSIVRGKQTAVVGQSGVGKSSLLNAIDPGLELRVSHVSAENEKGRHTTTAAKLIPLGDDGFIVDTPGIRQFQLWDIIPEEVAGLFRDIRPYVAKCRFPDCTHTHEQECAVKDAVADGYIDIRRYESFCQIRAGDDI